jgi:trimethylamine--corrinoid protein Co-methyltransferase
MTFKNQSTEVIASLVHDKSTEILLETGFCVPDAGILGRLAQIGFIVDHDSQMVKVTQELLDTALTRLPKDVQLFDRAGQDPAPYDQRSCFMGAGTPVNVFDLESGTRRPATRKDVRQLVTLQDALPNVDIVRPTVTATDHGEFSDLVEIAELLTNTSKPVVHRVLAPERVDAAFEMLAAVAG